jgi:hypothetical protein
MKSTGRPRLVRRFRPEFIHLEDRCVPAVIANLAAPHELNSILVRFTTPSAAATFNAKAVLRDVTMSSEIAPQLVPGLRQVTFNPAQYSVPQVLTAFGQLPSVAYAEPNYTMFATLTPNDPMFNTLWGLHNTGQTIQSQVGLVDKDIDAPEAWDRWTGSGNFVIGVIDTGVDYNHPDLAANIYSNPGEIANNGIDDDNNGRIDDIRGWDFLNNDNNPMDDHNHGTHCAGTIGGVGNNNTGVTGVNWNIKIMPLKFLGSNGSGPISAALGCLNYATMMGVKITSNSWGGGGFSSAFNTALNNAQTAGHIFVAAAGNANNNNDVNPFYPATYPQNNVVSVAATDNRDNRASFSSYGATTVDLGAPGVAIRSTVRNNGYAYFNGTSMATPHVAGAMAFIWDMHPNLTYQQVIQRVYNNVDLIPSMTGRVATNGRLNLDRAAFNGLPNAVNDTYATLEEVPLTVLVNGVLANDTDSDADPLTAVLVSQPANGSVTLNANGTFTYTPNANFFGTDSFTYRANDRIANGNLGTVFINVTNVNDAPVGVDDSYTALVGALLSIPAPGVLANDSDIDNLPSELRAVLVTPPVLGTLSLNADGSFDYQAPAIPYGTDTFQYQVSDGLLLSNVVTVTLREAIGQPPVSTPDNYTTRRNTAVSGNVLDNDSDPDGDPLTARRITSPANGSLVFNSDGSFTYTPNSGFSGTDRFTYVANDGIQDGPETVVFIRVDAEPVTNPDTFSTAPDVLLTVPAPGVLANDTDPELDPLTAELMSTTTNGVLTFNPDGSFDYQPNLGFVGIDSFVYRAHDGLFPGNLATVTINVGRPPVAVPDSYTTTTPTLRVDAASGVLINDTGVNGPLTARLRTGPSVGVLTLNPDGSFDYTAPTGFAGTAFFTYVANDGIFDSNEATVTIVVDVGIGVPIANNDSYNAQPNQLLAVPPRGVLSNDIDPNNDTLMAFLVTSTSNGSLNFSSDGSFLYLPNFGFLGTDTFTYHVFDGSNFSNTATVTINVRTNPQPPPTPNPQRRVILAQETGGRFKIFHGDTGSEYLSVQPYGGFFGSIRIATADFTGDNVPDVLVGPGPQAGTGPGFRARVYDGNTGQLLSGPLGAGFLPFGSTYRGGMQVATGDVTGDGKFDVIVAADSDTVSPQVAVYNGQNGALLSNWLGGFTPYTAFGFGGVRVAAADVNGDGRADIITAPGAGVPTVKVFNAAANDAFSAQILQFNAYTTNVFGGTYVAAGDLDGDGRAEIVTGATNNPEGNIRIFNGTTGAFLRGFSPTNMTSAPVRVALGDINDDDRLDVVVGGQMSGFASRGRVYDATTLAEMTLNPGNLTFGDGYNDALFVAAFNKVT